MPNVKNNAAAQETCRKLIDAAGEVFAERGLHAATIKEITDRAGVNVAAINYHFRDKFELYAAVIRYALSLTPVAPSAEKMAGSPEDRLRAFVLDLIEDRYDPSRPAWRATLLAHEFAQPTAALTAVMDELIRPRSDCVNNIVRDILGPNASEEQVLRAALSVGAQCFFYLYNGEVVRRLHPQLFHDHNGEELVAHITKFSLAALHAMR
jgi:AcrR family transcriptional regulator